MGITSQIHRSLHEMESSTSAVSFALIPREDYEKTISSQIVDRGIINGVCLRVANAFWPRCFNWDSYDRN